MFAYILPFVSVPSETSPKEVFVQEIVKIPKRQDVKF